MRDLLILAVSGSLAVSILSGCGRPVSRGTRATVEKVEGANFLAASIPGATAHKVDPGSQVRVGETIQTSAKGRITLGLLPGALIQIEPNSIATLERLTISKHGNETENPMRRDLRVRLTEGVIFVLVKFEQPPTGPLVVTSHGQFSANSAGLCRVEAKAEKMRLTSVRGEFVFRSIEAKATELLKPGYVLEWPSPGVPAPADADAHSQKDVEESLQTERILLDLEHRKRFLPYPWRQL